MKIKFTFSITKGFLMMLVFIVVLTVAGNQNSIAAENISKSNVLGNPGMAIYSLQSSRPLTFDERIACQKAIERVYYSHRTWNNPSPKPQFEEVISNDSIREKVNDIIRKSNALEFYWQRPITAEQLQTEINRMAGHTKSPEVLKELINALNNDPHLVAECIARPNLADRFIHNYYALDKRFHHETEDQAKLDLHNNFSVAQMKQMRGEYSEMEWIRETRANKISKETGFTLNEQDWNMLLQQIKTGQLGIKKISELKEDDNKFYIQAVLDKSDDRVKIAQVIWHKKGFDLWWRENKNLFSLTAIEPGYDYRIPPIGPPKEDSDTWQPTFSCLKERWQHTAVWTGTEMIIWGGMELSGGFSNQGARYNPSTDTWICMSTIKAPSARAGHTAIWAERRKDIIVMIIWGGYDGTNYLDTGAWYDPAKDAWTKDMAIWGAPMPRRKHTAIWIGARMIIWGGEVLCDNPPWCDLPVTNTGASYDPALENSWIAPWRQISRSNNAAPRSGHTAVWDQADMIIWGGYGCMDPPNCEWYGEYLVSGGKYQWAEWNGVWSKVSTTNAPDARKGHTAVWSVITNEMIVWGGLRSEGPPYNFEHCLATGGKYDPVADHWVQTPIPDGIIYGRYGHTAIWTGTEMIIWGGHAAYGNGDYCYGTGQTNDGAKYDPSQNQGQGLWTTMSGMNSPSSRKSHTAVWTGSEMIIWGGCAGNTTYNGDCSPDALSTGGRYSLQNDSWVGILSLPTTRRSHTAVWTGTEMIIWGGYFNDFHFIYDLGARYNPAIDNWASISSWNSPGARYSHTAIWTGNNMIVWGGDGYNGAYLNTGGRYNPDTDSWLATETGGDNPIYRDSHKAIWTGSKMLIWGGYNGAYLSQGGIYDPSTPPYWSPMASTDAPVGRAWFDAVWTGTEMIVWGGYNGAYLNSGGRYNPSTNLWNPVQTSNAPDGRDYLTAVWASTTNEMIVWGGGNSSGYLNTGGRYNPSTNLWNPAAISIINAPNARDAHTAVWTGSPLNEMIIWGGRGSGGYLNSGGIYDPVNNTWTSTSILNAPTPRYLHTAIWTGSQMIIWGGSPGINNYFNSGGIYTP